MKDLLPCPNLECLGTQGPGLYVDWADVEETQKVFFAKCPCCKTSGPWAASIEAAIDAWNSLPRADTKDAEIARLRRVASAAQALLQNEDAGRALLQMSRRLKDKRHSKREGPCFTEGFLQAESELAILAGAHVFALEPVLIDELRKALAELDENKA